MTCDNKANDQNPYQGVNPLSNEPVLDESTLPERVVADLRRYLLQRSLTIGEASTTTFNGGKIHSGRAVLRGLYCQVDVFLAGDQSLLVLCAKPETPWVFSDCFPEIPNEASVKDFFVGAPPKFKEPVLSKVGLANSVWVLVSAEEESLIQSEAPSILARLDTWSQSGKASNLVAGLNLLGKPSFDQLDLLQGDELLKKVLPSDWDFTVQANIEYRDGASVLSLPIPLVNKDLSLGPCKLTDLTLWLSTPMYYVRSAPNVRLVAKLKLDSKKFNFSADYPIDGDIVEARLEVEAGLPIPFIGEPTGLHDLKAAPDIELTVGVSISKSNKTLEKASLDLVLHQKWEIAQGVLEIANPEFHFLVLDPVAETRRVVARVTGELKIADSTLAVSGNYAASGDCSDGQFAVRLDPETPLSLTALVQHLLGQDAVPSALSGYELEELLFEFDLHGHIFMETTVSVPWNIPLTEGVSLEFQQLRFLFEKWGDSKRFRARADLELGGVRFSLSGDYSSAKGWLFQGAMYPGEKINIGAFAQKLADELGAEGTIPASLADVSLQDIVFLFNTKTKDLAFTIKTTFPVGEKALDAVVTIEKTGNALKFGGKITVGGAVFTLDFKSSTQEKVLKAQWRSEDSGQINLKAISDDLPDLSELEMLLMPTNATLTLNLSDDKKSLLLDCTNSKGAKVAFLLAQDPGATPPKWIAALGLNPPPISMEDLGPLGDVLKPHHIVLKNLVIVAASANAPKGFQLPEDFQPKVNGVAGQITKGLLLQGALAFKETSFSYPFECRLGGEKRAEQRPEEKSTKISALPVRSANSPGETRSDESTAPEEGKNNVAIGRTIGPVTFRRARLESRNKRIYVLLDASLGSGGFELDLDGFNINFPLEMFKDPSTLSKIGVDLDGLSIAYSKPPLMISGGFAKAKSEKPYIDHLYQGHLLVKAATFQITVLGSYGTIVIKVNGDSEKKPSLFIYGSYDGVVGGPAAFYVTGLALGGGYNTRLAIPPVEKVAEFPLVQAVTDPKEFKIEALRQAVQPSYGDLWLAAGVKFNSFKMADSFALFSVAFGNRLQFAMLGLTKLTMPAGAKEGKCSVYAELAIRAVLDPEAGVFSIEGRLTQNSYVFAKELRLTGGFAFFVWFGNATEAGDFIISLGGYHPAFLPPPHYPLVPRVGIHGQIGALTITGEAYLALTPSCLMAGQRLEAVFQSGNIRATFVAFADFLIAWAPFYYDARIGIGMAVTVRLWRTFKLEISASLHVWGPPFAGTARVSLWIVSFTVEFGDRSGAQPPLLEWVEFQKAFLPSPDPKGENGMLSTIRITEGLVREVKKQQAEKEVIYRIVNPHELMIETDSAVPCSEVCVGRTPPKTATAKIGIRPMGATTLTSRHEVSIRANGGGAVEEKFKPVQWSQKNYPEALWSPIPASGKPEAGLLKDVPSGAVLRVQPKEPKHLLGPFLIEKFAYEEISKKIPWLDLRPPAIDKRFSKVAKKKKLRKQIRDCLAKRLSKPSATWNEITMENTADKPKEFFQALPRCAALGQSIEIKRT
jgi:hypothetical protein